eukprot:SAG31_NODE_13925_length_837_cov_1.112466_1_plen_176_part_00
MQDLLQTLNDVLNEIHGSAKAARGSKRDAAAVERACMQYAALAALCQRPALLVRPPNERNNTILRGVLEAMICIDPAGSRHAVALLCQYAESSRPAELARLLARQPRQHFRDALARAYHARLCHTLAASPAVELEQRSHYLQTLTAEAAGGESTSSILVHPNPETLLLAFLITFR